MTIRRPTRPTTLLLAGALAVAIGGCGVGDDRDRVRDVVIAFHAALDADRPGDACAQLSPDTVEALERQEQAPCDEAIGALDVDGGAIAATEVYIVNAKVDLDSGESAFLSREAAGWRISALGCRPADGKPADRPFACEVEA